MRVNVVFFATAASLLGASIWAQQKPPTAGNSKIDFNRDVKPILSEKCFKCHGPDAQQVFGKLRLDQEANATKDRGGYRVIHAGNSKDSELMKRVMAKEDERMPPADSGLPALTPKEIQTLRTWIDQGAQFAKHWAFVPPQMPKIPSVKNSKWARNPIDSFVLARLEHDGLKPEKEADKPTLLRRASLTLTGLPPTPAELDAFLKDKSPNAYEKQVDRLLASPRYGENQARYWLDAVRYGDTHGLHLDNERAIYPYRDWVVRAFNQDLDFEKFTLWQFAGDLLPNPTTEMKIATGYIRMNPTTSEGGAIVEEFLAKNTFDRVDTTGTVFLGMTIGCARCHDHKYDPVSATDYYQLYAYFNSTKDEPLDGNALTPDPVMKAPTPDQEAELTAMKKRLDAQEAKVDLAAARSWIETARVAPPVFGAWEASDPIKAESFDKAHEAETEPQKWNPVKIENGKDFVFVKQENAYGYLRTTLNCEMARKATFEFASDDGIKVWLNGKLIHDKKVFRSISEKGDSVTLDLQKGENKLVVKITNAGGGDGFRYRYGDPTEQRIDDVYRSKKDALLRPLFLEMGPASPEALAYRKLLKEYRDLDASIPMTLVAQELPMPRKAFVLRRGEYNLPTTEVKRALPKALGQLPAGAPNNRLGFAKWLIDSKNPLVDRVFVNRIWQQHFGTGIVKTAEDFGNQGEFPSHPELLDYLAVKFVKDGCSVKKLHRLILTSAAFRQAAIVPENKKLKDPENRLISRGPRFRLDAEVLRDQALYVSGLLNEKRGGKGFKPYQPAGLWEEIAFADSNTSKYKQDTDDSIYRRSLYLFWKRTSPHPIMLTFDAPMREMCVVRRARTNTPLQALLTLNEPAFLEASRVFGERIVASAKTTPERARFAFRQALGRDPKPQEAKIVIDAAKRYEAGYRANPAEAQELIKVGLKPVKKLDPAEVATWTMISSTLFNLDEFLTQH